MPTTKLERLSVALEDGTVEKVRELAGGERKVGGFLSDLIAWAWEHRETLGARPLHEFAPTAPAETSELAQLREKVEQQQQQIDGLGETLRLLGIFLEATSPQVVGNAARQTAEKSPQPA